MATRQLALIPSDDEHWKLDEHTKAVGRAGVARARLALSPGRGTGHDPSARRPFDHAAA
jgi:hypothetical protein